MTLTYIIELTFLSNLQKACNWRSLFIKKLTQNFPEVIKYLVENKIIQYQVYNQII